MNATQGSSSKNGLLARNAAPPYPGESIPYKGKGNNRAAAYPPVSRVVTKESLHGGDDDACPPAQEPTVVSSDAGSPPLNDDDGSIRSTLFDFSILEPGPAEKELLSLPLTAIELPLSPPPPEATASAVGSSTSFDSCAAALLTPAVSVSTHGTARSSGSTDSLLSTAAAIAAQQRAAEAQLPRVPRVSGIPHVRAAPPIVGVGPANPKLPSVISPKQRRRKPPAKKKAAGKNATLARPRPHSKATNANAASRPTVVPAPDRSSKFPRPRFAMEHTQPGQRRASPPAAPQPAASAPPTLVPRPAPAPPAAALQRQAQAQAAAQARGQAPPSKYEQAHAPAGGVSVQGYAHPSAGRAPAPRARAPSASLAAAPPAPSSGPANAVSAAAHPGTGQVENTGRWTSEEHRLFLQGLEAHGKGWKKIATLIKSRTVVQIRTHAQKYFQKLAKARQNGEPVAGVGMGTVGGGVVTGVGAAGPHGGPYPVGTAEGAELGIAVPVGPDGQPVVTMRTAAHARAAGDPAGARGGARKRRGTVPGGTAKRRAIGNVVRSAVREGRNVKRQTIAEAKRQAAAAVAGAVARNPGCVVPSAGHQAPAAVVAAGGAPGIPPPKVPPRTAGDADAGEVPNPLPSVSTILEPYVSTAAAAFGMRPTDAPARGKGGEAKVSQKPRGRHQLVQTATHGTLPMAALEDAVFRLLTPATGAPSPPVAAPHAPGVASNGIVDPLAPKLPAVSHAPYRAPPAGQGLPAGTSPTGVADTSLLPGWVDAKNPPQWYTDGSDIDTLLEDADCLNWLSDTGDLEEAYPPAVAEPAAVVSSSNSSGTGLGAMEPAPVARHPAGEVVLPSADSLSFLVDPAEMEAAGAAAPLPPARRADDDAGARLPAFLDGDATGAPAPLPAADLRHFQPHPVSAALPYAPATEAVESVPEHRFAGVGESDTNLMGFADLDMGDEQAFVSALLETSGHSTMNFPKLHSDLGMSQGSVGPPVGAGGGALTGEEHVLDEN